MRRVQDMRLLPVESDLRVRRMYSRSPTMSLSSTGSATGGMVHLTPAGPAPRPPRGRARQDGADGVVECSLQQVLLHGQLPKPCFEELHDVRLAAPDRTVQHPTSQLHSF